MTHTMLAAYMVLDAAIAIGFVWLLREAAKTDRDRMTATFYGMTCRLERGRWVMVELSMNT